MLRTPRTRAAALNLGPLPPQLMYCLLCRLIRPVDSSPALVVTLVLATGYFHATYTKNGRPAEQRKIQPLSAASALTSLFAEGKLRALASVLLAYPKD